MKVYISGPMTGIEGLNFPAFHASAKALRDLGHSVVNPAEIVAGSTDWKTAMREDIKAMLDCDAVALLHGWERSSGAHIELHVAHRLGLEIMMVSDLVAKGAAK